MRILQITKKFPWPLKDGEVIAITNLTLGLSEQGHHVTVLALNTLKHHSNPNQLPESIKKSAEFVAVDIDTGIKPWKAFLNLFSTRSYNIERFYSKEFEQRITTLLQQEKFDLILLEGIYLMRYIEVIRKHNSAKILLRLHNAEYIIWERLRDAETGFLTRIYLGILAARMKRFELAHINLADIGITLSPVDEQLFAGQDWHIPHKSFPVGYIIEALPQPEAGEENAVAFIGSMDWMPNREGVEWFIAQVWPQITTAIPEAKFYLAGRNFPEEMKKIQRKGIVILGEVEDAKQFILSKPVFIVPLFAGSGMRIKIIEAMALGRAVVSTTVGAEGIEFTDGENIMIADEAGAFARAVIKVLQSRPLRLELGNNAQKLVLAKYDNRKICADIISFCKPYLN